jgi:hypothetical protein
MDSLAQAWEQAADRRSFFLRCYAMMTGNMLVAVDQGEFHDAAWVARLLDLFADYYFVALDAYQHDDTTTPAVWRLAHDTALQQQSPIIQDLLLGINAHINYDLVLALVDMLEPDWQSLAPEQQTQRYQDHSHVNDIIAGTIDSVQQQVVAPDDRWMGLVDWMLGPLDEHVAARLIRQWREDVWRRAMDMLAAADPDERADLRRLLAAQSLERGEQILALRIDRILGDLL